MMIPSQGQSENRSFVWT